MLVKLCAEALVDEVPIQVYEVAVLIDSAPVFIIEETLFVTLEIFDLVLTVLRVVKIATHIVTVEVVALQVERWREFSFLIKFISFEDVLATVLL